MIKNKNWHRWVCLAGFLLAMLPSLFAGRNPQGGGILQLGAGAPSAYGDYLVRLSTPAPYVFWIEVPPGTGAFTVIIYDPDVGGAQDIENSIESNGYDTDVRYALYDPAGNPVSSVYDSVEKGYLDQDDVTAFDGLDMEAWTIEGPSAPGHWKLVVDMSMSGNGGDANYYELWVLATPEQVAFFDFESSPALPASWPAPDARWEAGAPLGYGGSQGSPDPASAYSGNNVLGYNLGYIEEEEEIGGYEDDITTPRYVTTSSFNLSAYRFVRVYYQRWLGVAEYDQVSFEVSINGGSDWTAWWENPKSTEDPHYLSIDDYTENDGWFSVFYDVSELAAGEPDVRFRWGMGPTTNDGNTYCGWNIDDLKILGYPPPELNVYAETYIPFGNSGFTQWYLEREIYPYLTCGCEAYAHFFDSDGADLSGEDKLVISGRLLAFKDDPEEDPDVILHEYDVPTEGMDGGWSSAPIAIRGEAETRTEATDYGIWKGWLEVYVSQDSPPPESAFNGNVLTFYMGNHENPTPPAESGNSVRLYFPTDDYRPPDKPFLIQSLSYVSGEETPTNGLTTRIQITVAVVNPTPHAITFGGETSHVVTAHVPAADEVWYVGNAWVSKGSVTGQPAAGESGAITWNPGSVAAGATALLRYSVDVTPSAADQEIPVTGTPAADGTTATFVDETGNSSQLQAVFTLGPLCGLAVTEGGELPTRVTITAFSAGNGGEPFLAWTTAAEHGTVAFHVHRWDDEQGAWRRVNAAPLPALIHEPQGGVYRLADPEALPGQTYQYRIEELDVHGRVLDYGPFTVTIPEPASNPDVVAAPPVDASGSRTPHPRQRRDTDTPNLKPAHLKTAVAGKTAADGARPEAAKVAVRADGLHAVTFDALAEALALPRAAVEALAHRGRLEITSGGRLVTYLTDLAPGAIVFYGRRSDSPYADANVYRVAVGRGQLMARADGAPPAAVASGLTFATTQDAEEDHLPAPAVTRNPESDYWFWDYLFADHPTQGAKTFTVPTPAPAGTGAAALAVRLHGGTDTGFGTDHQVSVRLNGVNVGTARWDGLTARSLRFTIDPAILRDGANAVELAAHLNDGIPYSLVYVDGFAVDYVRQARADNDRLRLAPGGMAPHAVAVDGFTRDDIVVLDITDPDAPVLQPTAVERTGRNWRAFFRCQPRHDYFAASAGTAAAVTAASPDWPSRLRETESGADYVVIAPQSLLEPAEALAAYRAGQGHRALVVDLADIYDEFNHGRSSPHAIRDFLAWAVAHWSVAPRHVVLAGRGTYDYRDLGGFGDNLLPPLYLGTSHGLAAADNRFACVAGDDNVPDLAIGRLPAATAAELQAMVDKIIAYEALPGGAWSRRALVVADNPDPAGDFPADSETVAAELPPWLRLRRISLAEQTAVEAREALVSGIATGAGLVNYLGHGGVDRLAAEGVLRLDDVPLLANGARLPLVLAFTCAAGECTIPGYPGLGEALLTRPAGGAIAVYAPAGLSDNAAAVELNAALAAELGRGHATLGEALRAALAAWAPADPTAAYHRDLYILLGDPALRLVR